MKIKKIKKQINLILTEKEFEMLVELVGYAYVPIRYDRDAVFDPKRKKSQKEQLKFIDTIQKLKQKIDTEEIADFESEHNITAKNKKFDLILPDGTCIVFGQTRVRVIRLDTVDSFYVKAKHLKVRRVGATGVITGYVPGHGGDAFWVKHDDDGAVGAYMLLIGKWKYESELEVI